MSLKEKRLALELTNVKDQLSQCQDELRDCAEHNQALVSELAAAHNVIKQWEAEKREQQNRIAELVTSGHIHTESMRRMQGKLRAVQAVLDAATIIARGGEAFRFEDVPPGA